MEKEKLLEEIERVRGALEKTRSEKLKRDYSKYLKRLRKEAGIPKERRG